MKQAQVHFYTIPETYSLITVITYKTARIEIPDSSFEWDTFIAAVDNDGTYKSGGVCIGSDTVTFKVGAVLKGEQKIGVSISIPKKRCAKALKRFRDIIEEFSAGSQDKFIRSHSSGTFE